MQGTMKPGGTGAGGAVVSPLVPFTITLLLGAFLLFAVEPLVAKSLLPSFGGSAEVWMTCLFVFQLLLLGGYTYAHLAREWLTLRGRVLVHIGLAVAALMALPVALPTTKAAVAASGAPAIRLVLAVLWTVGAPFFVLSATGPVLQSWFTRVAHADSQDPYFLYGAGNIGSLLALVAYPALIEPALGLRAQSRVWSGGYIVLIAILATCGIITLRSQPYVARDGRASAPLEVPTSRAEDHDARPAADRWRERSWWLFCSFVPSSMLLAITAHITIEVAPLPLFWFVPLALYLTTFAVVFARKPVLTLAITSRVLPLGATLVTFALAFGATSYVWIIVPIHLFTFFIAAMVCHGQLASGRPGADRLGEYYVILALGGALGGLFNVLIAPAIFDSLLEYPLIVVAACLCRQTARGDARVTRRDFIVPACIGALGVGIVLTGRSLGLPSDGRVLPFLLAVPLFLNYHFLTHRFRFATGLLAVAAAGIMFDRGLGRAVTYERNFYGTVRIARDATKGVVQLTHGTTLHGFQWIAPSRRREPTGYYHRAGPVGDIIDQYVASGGSPAVGIVGLGVGTMAAYARPGEQWTFYEINPAVVRIASDPRYFTFLDDAFPAPSTYAVMLGDARLELATARDHGFGLLVLDAFTSDAIPMHLMTREALALYLQKIAEHGTIAFHISNRFLDLRPALAALVADAGIAGLVNSDVPATPSADDRGGRWPSRWVVIARVRDDLGPFRPERGWRALERQPGLPAWTDELSSVASLVRL